MAAQGNRRTRPSVLCRECGFVNEGGRSICYQCKRPIPVSRAQHQPPIYAATLVSAIVVGVVVMGYIGISSMRKSAPPAATAEAVQQQLPYQPTGYAPPQTYQPAYPVLPKVYHPQPSVAQAPLQFSATDPVPDENGDYPLDTVVRLQDGTMCRAADVPDTRTVWLRDGTGCTVTNVNASFKMMLHPFDFTARTVRALDMPPESRPTRSNSASAPSDERKDCPSCNLTGSCQFCKQGMGVGFDRGKICKICGGTGRCKVCGGSGHIKGTLSYDQEMTRRGFSQNDIAGFQVPAGALR